MISYLPKNTSMTQPCDAGIICDVKRKCRTRLIRKILDQIDSSPTAANYKPSLLDSVEMVAASWSEVKPTTIANCFRKASWSKALPHNGPGEFHDQAGANWIVFRGLLRGHNDTPYERPTPARPISRPGVGRP
jgi:hypothetical protein